MRILFAVTQAGSLSAAGRALAVPVATVSRKVTKLEAQLGTRLLVRTTRHLALTDAGAAYVDAARRILEQVADAEREAAGEFTQPRGELVISAPLLFGRLHVLPVVADFLALHPDIQVRLALADRNVDLVGDQVDMAVRIGRLPDSAMVATSVGAMRTVVCASPDLLALFGLPKSPQDMAGWPCVTVETPMPGAGWRFTEFGSRQAVDVPVVSRLSVTTPEAAAQAAVAGVGAVRLLHYQVVDAVASGALSLVLEHHEPEPVPVHLIHASRGQMPLKMRRFIDFTAPRLRHALAALPPAGRRKHRTGPPSVPRPSKAHATGVK